MASSKVMRLLHIARIHGSFKKETTLTPLKEEVVDTYTEYILLYCGEMSQSQTDLRFKPFWLCLSSDASCRWCLFVTFTMKKGGKDGWWLGVVFAIYTKKSSCSQNTDITPSCSLVLRLQKSKWTFIKGQSKWAMLRDVQIWNYWFIVNRRLSTENRQRW